MTATTLRARAVARRATALGCDVKGSGTPLLLLHDLGASGAFFDPLLDRLTTSHKVIVPDLRGHGRSGRLAAPASLGQMTGDVANVLDLLRVPSCFVLGYGAGGAIAQQLARSGLVRVRGLVLVCSYAYNATSVRVQIERRLRRGLALLTGGVGQPADVALGSSENPGAAQAAQVLLGFDSRLWLHDLRCPTLVIAGEQDMIAPLQQARELAEGIPDAQLQVIPGAGHGLIQTHSQALLERVLPWLAKQQGVTS